MHPGVTQVQPWKTEQIIHDACEVQVDIFSSFKVRLLQLQDEARRRRAGFETISLPLPSYIIKEMSGCARQLRRVLAGQILLWRLWMWPDVTFWGKTGTWSPTREAQFEVSGRSASAFLAGVSQHGLAVIPECWENPNSPRLAQTRWRHAQHVYITNVHSWGF